MVHYAADQKYLDIFWWEMQVFTNIHHGFKNAIGT